MEINILKVLSYIDFCNSFYVRKLDRRQYFTVFILLVCDITERTCNAYSNKNLIRFCDSL